MNIKLRFALLFTLLVGSLLFISSLVIYFLYQEDRVNDFSARLKNEGIILFHAVSDAGNPVNATRLKIIQQLNSNNLYEEKLVIANDDQKVVFSEPNNAFDPKRDAALLEKIKQKKEYKYKQGNRDCLGIYIIDANTYVLISAVDANGIKRLTDLRNILGLVFIGGLLIAAFLAFFFVEKILQPLTTLSTQMAATTTSNLTEEVDEKSSYAEVNQIAHNFNNMRKRLNHAFESQKTFVHHASHELRTPLTTMLSQTEAALNRNLDISGYKAVLRSLKEDQTDLIELTNSLLIISQYEQISFSYAWPVARVDELLYDVIANCKRIFNDIEINLDFEALPENENDLLLRANEVLFSSAFRNLIKNGYNYSNNKKVAIIIRVDKPFIEIILINSGPQLTNAEIEKIKMPFFRGKNSMSKKGYGLGLSIASKIIDLHQGEIIYRSEGTDKNHFIIRLPIAIAV